MKQGGTYMEMMLISLRLTIYRYSVFLLDSRCIWLLL